MEIPKKAAVYIRVSTEEQTDYSPDVQKEELLLYAKQHFLTVHPDHIYIDEGFSGKQASNRPGFLKMIGDAKIKPRPFDLILIHKYDRFARNREDSVLYKSLLRKDCGISVVSIKEPIPENDKFAVIYESMLEAMAEYYSLNLAEEVKKTMIKKAHLGEYQAAAPFGYRNEKKSLVPHPEESDIVKFIFHQYLFSDKNYLQIAKELNDMGIRTRRNNLMESRSVQYILCNPVYCGYSRWTPTGKIRRQFQHKDSIIVKGDYPPLISRELFLETQKKIQKNKKSRTISYSIQGKHWLSGLVKCSCCGKSLIISQSKTAPHFTMQCSGYQHGQCKESHFIRSQIFLPCFFQTLQRILKTENPSFITVKKKESVPFMEQTIHIRQKKLEQKQKKIKDAYYSGVDSLEEYQKNKKELEQEKQDLLTCFPVSPFPDAKKNFPIEPLDQTLRRSELTSEQKQKAVRSVIEKIVYHKKEHLLVFYLKEAN